MDSFIDLFEKTSWEAISSQIQSTSRQQIENVLSAGGSCGLDGFAAMLSPIAGREYLEEMAQLSNRLTMQRFGKVIRMFAPIYLSNECTNICDYCGFSFGNKIPRKTLSVPEILKEISVLRKEGFEHVLVVTGESAKQVGVDYLYDAIKLLNQHFSNVSMEV